MRVILLILILCLPTAEAGGEAPAKASDPSPADDATLVEVPVTLSWGEAAGADNYNVYFSKVGVSLVLMGNVDVNEYEPFCLTGTEYQWRIDANNAEGATTGDVWSFTTDPNYTITLTGATGVTAVTPLFTFPTGTVDVYVAGSFIKHLTSGVEDNISLSPGQSLEYRCSNWNQITMLAIRSDKVTGDISGWVLPNLLTHFYVDSTSVAGDISGWVLPSSLGYFYVYSTSVSGDISGWVLPSSLAEFRVNSTSVSGDISGWVLPSSLAHFYVHSTSVSGDISGWVLPSLLRDFRVDATSVGYGTGGMLSTWPAGLTKVDFDNCGLTYLEVNRALADCVLSGKSTKQLDIAGTNAGPSQTGAADLATLQADTWTISINATDPQPPSKASIVSPSNGAIDVALDTSLQWSSAYDASDYNVYLDGSLLGNTTATLYYPTLVADHWYTWRIDPNHVDGGSTTGDAWTFYTIAEVEPEPNAPAEESGIWQKTRQWHKGPPVWTKRETGLEGWRKR